MNRRAFLNGALGATVLAHLPRARASEYDLVIRGGRVIDRLMGLDAVRDIGIASGRIAAVEATLKGEAAETLEARGKIVAPGLIDIHTHAGREMSAPALADTVTSGVSRFELL